MSKVLGVIPARWASSRLPGKPLIRIGGVPMVVRVLHQAQQATGLEAVVVASDDARILQAVEAAGGKALLTDANHPNGTSRLGEVAQHMPDYDAYVNIQGDEPFVAPKAVDALVDGLTSSNAPIATLVKAHGLTHANLKALAAPERVKVTLDTQQNALFFSRSLIPYRRDDQLELPVYQHLGLYAFKAEALPRLLALPAHPLELAEGLEQLRWLAHGYAIRCVLTEEESLSVDVPEDVARAEAWLAAHGDPLA